jgi:hypothetical protein
MSSLDYNYKNIGPVEIQQKISYIRYKEIGLGFGGTRFPP